MNSMKATSQTQHGAMLLEALIAILIFSLGILAIIAMQAASVRLSGDAKYRTQASLLVNKIIAQMWVADRTPTTLQANFDTASGVGSTSWIGEVSAALPGVSGVAANQPTVSVVPTPVVNPTGTEVTVTVFWNLPGEALANRHNATAIAQIR